MTAKPPEKPFLNALKGQAQAVPPLWLMRQAGRYLPEYRALRGQSPNFLEFCYTPELATEVTLQPLRRYGFDAAILFSDILVVPDALGQRVRFLEGEGPVLDPIEDAAGIAGLRFDGALEHLSPVLETVARLSREIPETTALIGFAGAPWTVATYMVEGGGSKDHAKARIWAYAAPDSFARLIDLLVETTAAYLIAQVAHGAEALQLFDTWAGVLAPSQFARWVVEPTRDIVARVRAAYPEVPIIGFPRGAAMLYPDFVRRTGVTGVSIDNSVPPEWARDHIQGLACVQGNLDNMALVAGGEAQDAETRRILEALSGGPFIFNLGHGILPTTPPEHVARLVETVRRKR